MNTKIFASLVLALIMNLGWAQPAALLVDISAEDLLSGTADERLKELGAQAVTDGKAVIVTAPKYWHELIEEQIATGADGEDVSISFRETIIESVMVRLTHSAPAAPKPQQEAAPARATAAAVRQPPPPKPEIKSEPIAVPQQNFDDTKQNVAEEAQQALEELPQRLAQPEPEIIPPPQPVAVGSTAIAVADDKAEEAVIEKVPDEIANAVEEPQQPAEEQAVTQNSAAESGNSNNVQADVDPKREEAIAYFEKQLKNGRSINQTITPSKLRLDDEIATRSGVSVVIRRSKTTQRVYWLDGTYERTDPGLKRVAPGRYVVVNRLTGKAAEKAPAVARETPVAKPTVNLSEVDERTALEARYNSGKQIKRTLSPAALLPNDLLYTGETLTVIVRRGKLRLERYWLKGEVDLDRNEIYKMGRNKYRVERLIR